MWAPSHQNPCRVRVRVAHLTERGLGQLDLRLLNAFAMERWPGPPECSGKHRSSQGGWQPGGNQGHQRERLRLLL